MPKPCKTCGRSSPAREHKNRKQSSEKSANKDEKDSFHLDKKRFGKMKSWSSWDDSATTQYESYSNSETIIEGSDSNDRVFYRTYNKFKRECDINQYRRWKKYRGWLKFCHGKQINQKDWKKYTKWAKWNGDDVDDDGFKQWKAQEVTLDPEEWDKFQKWNKKKPKTKRVYHRSYKTYTKRK